ncbi:hypothetical protein FRB96_004713 [Tulasnella sp. 330]|nr:hypothetical protein FRB96_004713 [Tulasnella sp. 330]KAG8873588.1 hypothetical protein FRB97_006626 [Tulasnella sp. 331]KAG8877664.1 hypothetical protein FRB98_006591 [Tulasnella sp. 332]
MPLPFFSRKMSTDSTSSANTASTTSLTARAELSSLTSPSSSTLQTQESIPYSGRISPSAAAAVGWGKVVADGGYLSVHTLGSMSGDGKQLDLTTNLIRTDSTARLAELRSLMKAEPESLGYYIVPSEDAHQSEHVAAPDKRREFISGFTGSQGTAVISQTEALLFVDARYYTQAERQLDSNWRVRKVGSGGMEGRDWVQWLSDRPKGVTVGVDSRLISHETASQITTALLANGSRLKFPRLNLIDVVWKNRPPKPYGQIYVHEERFHGQAASEKLAAIRVWIKEQKPHQSYSSSKTPSGTKSSMANVPTATIIASLPNIAWLLNLRGSDLPFTPVFHAYFFVSLVAAVLFVDRKKVPRDVESYLKSIGVVLRDYGDVFTFLRTGGWGAGRVLIEPQTPYVISLMLSSPRYILAASYSDEMKALKNEAEVEGFRNAYKRDGAAMVRWYAWLDEKMTKGEPVSEWGASQKLTEYKRLNEEFVGLAYENISATGPNAAVPHYTPTRTNALLIDNRTPYVMDSGGQYFDGTCDTTRTMHYGDPTDDQMEAYTKVLKGHIALDSVIFPEGTTGAQLDVLARKALWKDGMNYLHGSGHGVGSFLNVHEGPHGFSNHVPLRPGHVLTNEPGFYKEGEFGVRIESAMVVRRVETKGRFGGDIWLGFERFTQVPIQTTMIKPEMLTKDERRWIKAHNSQVRLTLTPLLQDDKRALKWLKRESTRPGPAPVAGGVKVEWD